MDRNELTALTADIVAAYVSNNHVDTGSLSDLILTVHKTLAQTEQPSGVQRKSREPSVPISEPSVSVSGIKPSVPIRMSVSPNSITCLECGAEGKMLKRHILKAHGMTPAAYRLRWNLDDDYPLIAPAYSEKRRAIANNIGLGHLRPSNA